MNYIVREIYFRDLKKINNYKNGKRIYIFKGVYTKEIVNQGTKNRNAIYKGTKAEKEV